MFWKLRVIYPIVIFCCIAAASEVNAAGGKPAGRAVVSAEAVNVFSRMSADSKVLKTLRMGDVVTVEMEVEGADGAWCGIVESEQSAVSGYMQCKYLAQGKSQKRNWKHIGSTEEKRNTNETRVTVAGNTVLVPATLGYGGNAVEALLVLDTGASHTLITSEVASRLHIHPAETSKVQVQVVGGALVDVALARLSYISIDPHSKQHIVIGVIEDKGPLKYDGLLGMDFLRGLKYYIDFEKGVIRWDK
jgi:predicted aspartyl protease